MSGELPKGWKSARIETIAEAHMGETILAKQLTPTGLPVYSAGQENTPWGFLEQPKKPLGDGTVVISARGSIGFPKIPKAERFASTQTTIALHFPNKTLAAFACLWLKTLDWNGLTRGGAIPMLTVGNINELTMPLPPEVEQRRIVAKLEELLAWVNLAKERLNKASIILKRFRQAVLSAACSGRLTADWREANPSSTSYTEEELPLGWQTASVGEVIESLKYGTSQKCTYEKQGVPVLRIPNIEQGVVNQSDLKYADLQNKEFQQLRLRSGDILMIRSNGSVSLVGKSALVREIEEDFAYAGYLIRLRPHFSRIIPDFLNLVMGSHDVRVQIEVPARSTSGVHNINSSEVRALQFLLPPLGEQQEIAQRVQAMFKLANAVEKRVTIATARAEKLTQAILAKAFRGELVPTEAELTRREGRTYELASELLARIKSNR